MTEWQLTKLGDGPQVAEGAVLDVHVRTAADLVDFDDDARVNSSTYREGRPLRIVVSRDSLLPEVFQALLGTATGSTLVVPVSVNEHGLAPGSSPGTMLYVEVWIAEVVGEPVDAGREVLATRTVMRAESALEQFRRALAGAVEQRNAWAVTVKDGRADEFLALVEEHRAGTDLPVPSRLKGGVGSASFMLAKGLYARMVDVVSELIEGY